MKSLSKQAKRSTYFNWTFHGHANIHPGLAVNSGTLPTIFFAFIYVYIKDLLFCLFRRKIYYLAAFCHAAPQAF